MTSPTEMTPLQLLNYHRNKARRQNMRSYENSPSPAAQRNANNYNYHYHQSSNYNTYQSQQSGSNGHRYNNSNHNGRNYDNYANYNNRNPINPSNNYSNDYGTNFNNSETIPFANYGAAITRDSQYTTQQQQPPKSSLYYAANSDRNNKNDNDIYTDKSAFGKTMSILRDLMSNMCEVYSSVSKYFWRLVIFLGILIFVLMVVHSLFFNESSYTLSSTANKNRFKHNPTTSQPFYSNIVWVIADDLGYSDVSYNGGEIITSNIDYLASQGVILTHHYAQPLGAPTRAALMTGRYPFRMGLQTGTTDGNTMLPATTVHMPNGYETIAQKLKDNGYKTYAFGKWDLGYANEKYTPLSRGFDGHIGFYQSEIDYYDRTASLSLSDGTQVSGYDWYQDGEILKVDTKNKEYTTYELINAIHERIRLHSEEYTGQDVPLFMQVSLQNPHLPLEVPNTFNGYKCNIIHDSVRKEYCKSVQMLDYAVGSIVTSLMKYKLWEDTLFIFTSDNGAVVPNSCSKGDASAGTNYPYRGEKGQLFEGGVLTPSFVSGPRVPVSVRGSKSNILMHAVDWVPTILHFIEDKSFKSNIDGIDLYDAIIYPTLKKNSVMERDSVPINIEISESDSSKYINTAIRNERYKLIYNIEKLENCDIISPKPRKYPFSSELSINTMSNGDNMFLFDLMIDPHETQDLLNGKGQNSANYAKYKSIIDELTSLIENYIDDGYQTLQDATPNTAGYASKHSGNWKPWK